MTIATVTSLAIKGATLLLGKLAIIPIVIVALAYYNYDLMDPENYPKVTKNIRKEYDFVVIGGGSAGSVVVNRLTENPAWSVLLLEAGGHETEITDVPILSLYLHKSKLDWKYRTQPQDSACQAMVDRRCCWTRGKVGEIFIFWQNYFRRIIRTMHKIETRKEHDRLFFGRIILEEWRRGKSTKLLN